MNKRIQSGNTDLPDTKMGFHSSKEDEQLVISPAKVILDPEGDSQFFKRKTDSNDNNNSHEDEEWRRCLYFCYPCKESGHTFELFSQHVSSATHFSTVCSLVGRDEMPEHNFYCRRCDVKFNAIDMLKHTYYNNKIKQFSKMLSAEQIVDTEEDVQISKRKVQSNVVAGKPVKNSDQNLMLTLC